MRVGEVADEDCLGSVVGELVCARSADSNGGICAWDSRALIGVRKQHNNYLFIIMYRGKGK